MITTDSGLQYDDTHTGDGDTATAGQYVTVHYTGWLWENGARNSTPAWTATTRSSLVWDKAWSSKAGTKACKA